MPERQYITSAADVAREAAEVENMMENERIDKMVREALGNPDAVSYIAMLRGFRQLAQLTKDLDVTDEYPDGFDLENDEAVETLHEFISLAREITGEKPDGLIEED